ncbi:MAG: hypothetical protein H8E57_00455 [Candidatus Cloacimonetes bacterium]|nr:hypothetical protein [Candidatus Cloacimonadota bacterium]
MRRNRVFERLHSQTGVWEREGTRSTYPKIHRLLPRCRDLGQVSAEIWRQLKTCHMSQIM